MNKQVFEPLKAVMEFLGPGGILSKELSGYEYREEQIQMASAVLRNLQEGGILLVEAGTGTGKTLAYLIPALLFNQRVIISTGTKTLQEQIFYKDLGFFKKHFDFQAVMMKGRSNYLCWRRFYKFFRQVKMNFSREAELMTQLVAWAEQTETGDREELIDLSETNPVWEQICSDSDLCLVSNCEHFKDCFISSLKSRAQKADLVVVNHHLFFADISLRRLGFGEILPRYNAVIFDEAHLLEDIITDYFGVILSDKMIQELARDLREEFTGLQKNEQKELKKSADRIQNLAENFFPSLREHFKAFQREEEGKRFDFKIESLPALLVQRGMELVRELNYARSILSDKKDSPDLIALCARAEKQAYDLDFLLRQDEKGFVFYSELKPRSILLRASPIQVNHLMREILYPRVESIIFTSATLTVSYKHKPSFEYFKSRMGLEAPARVSELSLKSSFDWKRQALLFLPEELPYPDDPAFVSQASKLLESLLELSQGRAFLLFTSYRNLESFYELLGPRLKYPVLCQGDKPRSELLKEFRAIEESVLFATTSFWQGVDVVGPSLSLVVIDRLPFDSPGDPLVKARIQEINRTGGRAFFDYQVPSAVIMLRQGLGRLIRSRQDRGVLCVLDCRIRKKNYGKIFLESLPEVPITDNLKQVAEFFARESL